MKGCNFPTDTRSRCDACVITRMKRCNGVTPQLEHRFAFRIRVKKSFSPRWLVNEKKEHDEEQDFLTKTKHETKTDHYHRTYRIHADCRICASATCSAAAARRSCATGQTWT